MKSKAPSILSADLTVTGSVISDGEVQLDGVVEGDVRAASLTIGEEATVKGEVIAETVVIRGRVEGSVRARQVQLAATSRVEGDVIHASLAIESGAYFDGHCKRSSDPLGDAKSDKVQGSSASASSPPASPASSAKPSETSSAPKTDAPTAPPPASSASSAGGGAPAAKPAASGDPYAAKRS